MEIVLESAENFGIKPTCDSLRLSRASFYRWRKPSPPQKVRAAHPRALKKEEKEEVLDILNNERFVDQSPPTVYNTLLDEGVYLCSVSTMYRIMREAKEVRERRQKARVCNYKKPELLATSPNQVWSWDITKLKGPVKWQYFYLYVIIDIYSRYVVGWMVAKQELGVLARQLIKDSYIRQQVNPEQLTLHSDRGSSMKSKPVANLLVDLGVIKSHSRPSVSDDNPFSEAQFKTLKYMPEFPGHFGSIEDARVHCVRFFDWYNKEHYHSGIGYYTPKMVHYGSADDVKKHRQKVLEVAWENHPERFKRLPLATSVPEEVYINKPEVAAKENVLT